MSFFYTDDNCKIFYDIKGEGKPVLLVHGWSGTSELFHNQVKELSKEYQVITYDLRGHGQSDKRMKILEHDLTMPRYAKDLKQLIEYLNLKDVNITGWSMGTSILLCYIELFGTENLSTVQFIDMTPNLVNDETWNLGDFDAFTNMKFAQLCGSNWEAAVEEGLPTLLARNTSKDSELYQWMKVRMLDNIPYCMCMMHIAMCTEDYRDTLKKIDVPTLLSYSDGGDMYNHTHGEYMEENIKDAKLVMYDDCGHSLFLEDPEKFNREYLIFLKDRAK